MLLYDRLNISNFQSVIKPVLTYKHHVIERGEWFPWSAWKFSRMKVGVDLEQRKVMSMPKNLVLDNGQDVDAIMDKIAWFCKKQC